MLPTEILLVQVTMALYVLAVLAYVLRFATRVPYTDLVAPGAGWLAVAALTTMLVLRGVTSGRVPLISMYEYLIAFSWMVALAYLIFEWRAGASREEVQAAGAPALVLALALLGYAAFKIPLESKHAESLMPVLRSNWLIFHVSCAVIAYGAAGLASALALLYFVRTKAGEHSAWLRERLPSGPTLDRAVYHAVRFAFPFLTLVNVTGAIWAYNAWGRYWGWDPKETWSLITWMIYTFYLHARLRAQWRPAQSNAVVVVGIIAILFTFLGVSQLAVFSNSFHSYASGG